MTEQRKLTFHNHDLPEGFNTVPCKMCEEVEDPEYNIFEGHEEVIERSRNYPSHCQHPLDFYEAGWREPPHNNCYICDTDFFVIFRHCSLCDITVCLNCLRNPPPFTINFPKSHKHELTLLARDVTFTCNACGLEGKRNPYVCLGCSFMVHKDCIYLPRVININRHDHRVSRTSHLPHGNWECGVCRQNINCAHGAFTCKRCPSYAVHPKCATRKDVWDGQELEDEPEEEEIEPPFKAINETDIIHFSHEEHILRLGEEDDASIRCDCCVFPIKDDPVYKCVECHFRLHKTCANLPRMKRQFLHNHKLTLLVDNKDFEDDWFECSGCGKLSSGFRYGCGEPDSDCRRPNSFVLFQRKNIYFDIRCTSTSEPFHHELHPHPLYLISTNPAECKGCKQSSNKVLSCIVCDYVLGMECATLPRKVKHIRCDDHFLSLCQGVGNSRGDLWCDICEKKTDPSVWYYTCDHCGTTLHVNCVLGDLYHMKDGMLEGHAVEIIPNSGASRPLCIKCKSHCRFPFFMKFTAQDSVMYVCSFGCCKI